MNSYRIPFVKSDRTLFWIIFIAGFALCSGGIGQAAVRGWLHPISLLGYVFGGAAMLLGGSVLLNRPLGPVADARQAIPALLGLMVVKFALAALYPLF